jgi:hypothetical protein
VAQLGSALRSGRRGREFKSPHPDQKTAGHRPAPSAESGPSPSRAPLVRHERGKRAPVRHHAITPSPTLPRACPTTRSPCCEHRAPGGRTAASWHSPHGRARSRLSSQSRAPITLPASRGSGRAAFAWHAEHRSSGLYRLSGLPHPAQGRVTIGCSPLRRPCQHRRAARRRSSGQAR